MSLAKELAKLNQPAPRSIDPESFDQFQSAVSTPQIQIQTQPTPTLPGQSLRRIEIHDQKYQGKVVNKNDLFSPLESSSSVVSIISADSDNAVSISDSASSAESDSDPEEETDATVFQRTTQGKTNETAHTKAQLKLWGELIGIRIRLQPLLNCALGLPKGAKVDSTALRRTVKDLLALRKHAAESSTEYFPKQARGSLKRGRSEVTWGELREEESVVQKYYEEVFDRWHERSVHAMGISGKRLKAFNQSISVQVKQVSDAVLVLLALLL